MNLFKSLFSPTRANFVRWRYAALLFLGLQICWVAGDTLAWFAWVLGWVYGMEWQRKKAEIEKNPD